MQISYIGYNTQEITIDRKSILKVVLQEDQQALEEVVVIGYGAVKKKDLTGAIAQVKADKYATQQSTNVLDMLNGTVAGFNSNIGTSASGASEMEIRGPASLSANNSPLIVLDGVIFNGSINDINPSDIETIDVLKDASSAAVYGSRSAAGVVIINTKQGKGEKMSINFSAQLGLTDFTNEIKPNDLSGFIQRRQDFQRRINPDKPEGYYNNPNQLPEGIDVDTWLNYDASYQSEPILTWMTRLNLRDIEQQNYLNGNAYDWYGEATRPGLRQNYNVNISGGIGKTKYYWSLGYTDNHVQEALVLASKVLSAPNVVGELCWSDDPNYIIGYVSANNIYHRITKMKPLHSSQGGRVFFVKTPVDITALQNYLERQPILVDINL